VEILALVEATPDITLAEIADHPFNAHGERFGSGLAVLRSPQYHVQKNIARQRAGAAGRGRGTAATFKASCWSPVRPSLAKPRDHMAG
jgi:hypothetical protein